MVAVKANQKHQPSRSVSVVKATGIVCLTHRFNRYCYLVNVCVLRFIFLNIFLYFIDCQIIYY